MKILLINLNKKKSNEPNEWDVDLELDDIPEPVIPSSSGKNQDKNFVILPNEGPTISQIWVNNSSLAVDHAASGSFETAMKLLSQQVGVVNFAPLKPFFISLYIGSKSSLRCSTTINSLSTGINRNGLELTGLKQALPALALPNLQSLIENNLKEAFRTTTGGKFSEAVSQFIFIMHSILFVISTSKKETVEAKELLNICKEYISGLRLEMHRKDLSAENANGDPIIIAQLAAYFTHCNLQQVHQLLALRSAMNIAYKIKNYKTAASFARRLLELEPKPDVATSAKKVIVYAESNSTDAVNLDYQEKNPFQVCAISYKALYKNSPSSVCPFCQQPYLPDHQGKLCVICGIAQIGKSASGIRLEMEGKK